MKQLPADERAAEGEERLVEGILALEAYEQAPVAMEPGEAALGHPAVPAELLAGVDLRAGDARGDAPTAQRRAVLARGVCLVRVQLVWPLARAARLAVRLLEGWDGVDQP